MTVAVRKQRGTRLPGVTSVQVRRRAESMLDWLQQPDAELSVLLTDDLQIQELNRTYRQKDRPTDVLAFAMAEGEGMPHVSAMTLLGDVVISLPTASRQATAQGHTGLEEVTHLLAHGLLHLLGYDHESDEEEREMTALTRQLVVAAAEASEPRGPRKR